MYRMLWLNSPSNMENSKISSVRAVVTCSLQGGSGTGPHVRLPTALTRLNQFPWFLAHFSVVLFYLFYLVLFVFFSPLVKISNPPFAFDDRCGYFSVRYDGRASPDRLLGKIDSSVVSKEREIEAVRGLLKTAIMLLRQQWMLTSSRMLDAA